MTCINESFNLSTNIKLKSKQKFMDQLENHNKSGLSKLNIHSKSISVTQKMPIYSTFEKSSELHKLDLGSQIFTPTNYEQIRDIMLKPVQKYKPPVKLKNSSMVKNMPNENIRCFKKNVRNTKANLFLEPDPEFVVQPNEVYFKPVYNHPQIVPQPVSTKKRKQISNKSIQI